MLHLIDYKSHQNNIDAQHLNQLECWPMVDMQKYPSFGWVTSPLQMSQLLHISDKCSWKLTNLTVNGFSMFPILILDGVLVDWSPTCFGR